MAEHSKAHKQQIEAASRPQYKHTCPKCGGEFKNLPNHMRECDGVWEED